MQTMGICASVFNSGGGGGAQVVDATVVLC